METTTFYIKELCCVDEERSVRKRFNSVNGIDSLAFDFLSHRLVVGHSCPRHELADALHDIGYHCRLDSRPAEPESAWDRYHAGASTLLSGLLIGAGLLLRYFGASGGMFASIFALAIAAGGWTVAVKAYASLKQRSMDMNVLMIIASAGAFAIEKYEEAAAVIFLFAVSNWLERTSLERSKRRIAQLLELSPQIGRAHV